MIVIIDAPPGTSCPVIEAVKGSDFVILVTEPTPFGLNDLILAVEMVRALGIPFGVVINRSDIGDSKVREYCEAENIPILMEIVDDRKIAEAYSRGEIIIDIYPEYRKRLLDLYEKIESMVTV
jgi:MinD superfamily P-loop ATPase